MAIPGRKYKIENKKKFEQPESFFLVLLKAAIVTGGTKTGLQGKGHESVSIQSTGYSSARWVLLV